jgi:hypothetical protein
VRSRGLRRRNRRATEAKMVSAVIADLVPPELRPDLPEPRPDLRVDQQRRIAERRDRIQADRQRHREDAQRAAVELWDARVRAARERDEAEARTRALVIENARRFRTQRAAELHAQREAAEERRLENLRENEIRRREEAAERSRRRAEELSARRERGRETFAAMREDAIAEEQRRQHETELSRAAVVQLRSEEARELARSWIVSARTAEARDVPPPLWGEHQAAGQVPVDDSLVEDDVVVLSDQDEAEISLAESSPTDPARPREKVEVVALDIDTLNARLRR